MILWAALAVALIMSVHLSWEFVGSRCCDTCFAVSLLCCVRFSVSYKSLLLRRSELLTLFKYFHLKATAGSTSLWFELVCIPLYDFKSYTVILRSSFQRNRFDLGMVIFLEDMCFCLASFLMVITMWLPCGILSAWRMCLLV